MKLMIGIDIGNASTECAIAQIQGDGSVSFVAEGLSRTTGIKGTRENIQGVLLSIRGAMEKINASMNEVAWVAINEAAPVIGDVAMETITETIITESTMIGHNPETPGGVGLGVGETVLLSALCEFPSGLACIPVVSREHDFADVAQEINAALVRGVDVQGVILQKDDGVLVYNRLHKNLPIVDEVDLIDKVPVGVLAAVEVAAPGRVVETLSNPYGIATLFELDAQATRMIMPIARTLIGSRSAVVLKTQAGDVQERIIPAGKIFFTGDKITRSVDVDQGAKAIMAVVEQSHPIRDIRGEAGTHAGGMLEHVRQVMSTLSERRADEVKIQDLLAVDTFFPQKVKGGLAGEFSMNNAVGVAAMVQADRLQMKRIAHDLAERLQVQVEVGGVEADMAITGALTTPGTQLPLAIVDMGAGSTDASFMDTKGHIRSVHLAGAGDMVTLLINTELGLDDLSLAEDIKCFPLAKAESLFHIRHEDGTAQFFETPLPPAVFSRVLVLHEKGMIPVPGKHSLEKIRKVRRDAKTKVFVTNTLRALQRVSATGEIRSIDHVVLVGGSALDFEIPQMLTETLSHYGVVAGRGNIRGALGPRNAVATGLVLRQQSSLPAAGSNEPKHSATH